MKANAILITILLLLTAFIFLPASLPKAHAAGPVQVQKATTQGSGGSTCSGSPCTLAYGSNVGVNNLLVVVISVLWTTCPGPNPVTAVTDTVGTSFTETTGFVCINNDGDFSPIADQWYGSAKASGADTVSLTVTTGASNKGLQLAIYEYSYAGGLILASTRTGSGTCSGAACNGLVLTTTTTTAFEANSIQISAEQNNGNQVVSPGTGYTLWNSVSCVSTKGCSEYGSDATVTSPTNFPMTLSNVAGVSSDWVISGAVYAGATLVIVSAVTPCTFFQLQCWWYPMLFFGAYAGAFMLIASIGQASGKGKTYLLMAALTFCSLLEVKMGMLNAMFPLILTALFVVYAIRYK